MARPLLDNPGDELSIGRHRCCILVTSSIFASLFSGILEASLAIRSHDSNASTILYCKKFDDDTL